jgi:hypothetical protein
VTRPYAGFLPLAAAQADEHTLEAQTLSRIAQFEERLEETGLDQDTANILRQQAKEQLLKNYCLLAQLHEQGIQ